METLVATLLAKVSELEARVDVLEKNQDVDIFEEVYLEGMDEGNRMYLEEEFKKMKEGGK